MARSYLKEMQLSSMLRGDVVRHFVYVLNRFPTRALFGQMPYEAWTGVEQHVEHIHVFGCVAHMKVSNVHTKKLDDRSMQVVNLGKEPSTKAY